MFIVLSQGKSIRIIVYLSPRIGIAPAHYRTSPCSESFIGILWIRLAVLFVYGGELLTPRYSKITGNGGNRTHNLTIPRKRLLLFIS